MSMTHDKNVSTKPPVPDGSEAVAGGAAAGPKGSEKITRKMWVSVLVLSALVLGLWTFPGVYYSKTDPDSPQVWLVGQTNIAGWNFESVPVDESAERLLVADETTNGKYTKDDGRTSVLAFSAKRFGSKPNEIGLFIHTPDRCWTMAGWKFEPASPDHLELEVHGLKMLFERRIFRAGGQRELVYFGGLVGGQPVPYRLDHNQSVGGIWASDASEAKGGLGFLKRSFDRQLWVRVWDAFRSRRRAMGPKQFIRISTSLVRTDEASADRLLKAFLHEWLTPVPYGDGPDGQSTRT
jgi:hypothetical protein